MRRCRPLTCIEEEEEEEEENDNDDDDDDDDDDDGSSSSSSVDEHARLLPKLFRVVWVRHGLKPQRVPRKPWITPLVWQRPEGFGFQSMAAA